MHSAGNLAMAGPYDGVEFLSDIDFCAAEDGGVSGDGVPLGDDGQNPPADVAPDLASEATGSDASESDTPRAKRPKYSQSQQELIRKCVFEEKIRCRGILKKYPGCGFNARAL